MVLRDAGFTLRENEVLGLIGPNGSGKTTLFECLAALIPARTGEVTFNGRPLPAEHRKRVLFYLPDGIRPWPDQTVQFCLKFYQKLHKSPLFDGEFLAKRLGLEALLGARSGELSKGEAKRFLLALALLTPQPVLLLDEPFDGLDFRQTREVILLLRDPEIRQGRTLFLSIHQLTDAARVCDRFVLLSQGAVAGEGTLDELRSRAGIDAGLEEVFLALT